MHKRDIKRKVVVEINGEEKYVEKLFDSLCGMLNSPTCELDKEYGLTTDEYPYKFIIVETGVETVYPGCYTLPNGDPGYPDEYDDNLAICDDTIEEYISEFMEANNCEFEYYVSQNDEY